MSLLWPSVHIAITPGHVAVSGGKVLREASVDVPGWAGALKTLGTVLADGAWRGRAAITLSHHFAHVHCLPSPPVVLKPAEMRSWIIDYLDRHYGEMSRDWQLAWQAEAPGKLFLVGSVAASALAELEEAVRGASLKPASVQPWFAASWNRNFRKLGKSPGWLALLEPGRLILASLAGGDVLSLRSVPTREDPAAPLADLIRREALLAGTPQDAPVWIDSVLMRPDLGGTDRGLNLHALPLSGESLASMLGN